MIRFRPEGCLPPGRRFPLGILQVFAQEFGLLGKMFDLEYNTQHVWYYLPPSAKTSIKFVATNHYMDKISKDVHKYLLSM